MIIEKKHRLPLEYYKGKIRCAFTLCIRNREHLFGNGKVINIFNEILHDELKKNMIVNWAYIYMPDHLHILIEGENESSDLLKSVVSFKQKTGYWLSKNMAGCGWQKDFYDHILRKEENLKKHIKYILENPVRKGIVDNWYDYRFKGSLDFDLDEIL